MSFIPVYVAKKWQNWTRRVKVFKAGLSNQNVAVATFATNFSHLWQQSPRCPHNWKKYAVKTAIYKTFILQMLMKNIFIVTLNSLLPPVAIGDKTGQLWFKVFRLMGKSRYFLSHFWPLLKWVAFFEHLREYY